MKKIIVICIVTALSFSAVTNAALSFDADVTPDVIFGSGNANGSFTVDTANGVELGLRAKLRHNATGQPENTFNSNGDGTYTFEAGSAPTQSADTAVWSFEWSINSDVDGSTGNTLNDYTYLLSIDIDPTSGTNYVITFDPINGGNPGAGDLVLWDHSIGDNLTTESTDSIAGSEAEYLSLIANNNVAQNSWKPHWFGLDATSPGEYSFLLQAFDGATIVAETEITVVSAVPAPGAFLLGGIGISLVGWMKRRRSL